MTPKLSSIISRVLSIIILAVIGVTLLVADVIALNGFSDREAGPALITVLICYSASAILVVILVGRLTRLLMTKFNWNDIPAMMVSVFAGTLSGGFLFFPHDDDKNVSAYLKHVQVLPRDSKEMY